MNDYNTLSDDYVKSHEKADKKYSILPTTLNVLGPLYSKRIVDVGCGDGFLTRRFANEAELVYGIDNSEEQIRKAQEHLEFRNVSYYLSDMNEFDYPNVDVIFAPYVLNYLKIEEELTSLFSKFYNSLNQDGTFAGIIDNPHSETHDMKRFGSIKRLQKLEQGERINIELYHNDELITTLFSYYHTKKTIEKCLQGVGFKEITWHTPIVAQEGLEKFGEDFWKEYLDKCDLAYFSCRK